MKKLAIIVTRSGYNNVLQACEWAKLAAQDGWTISIFFRDEAASRMGVNKSKELTMSEGYRGRESRVRELLKKDNKADLQVLLQQMKEAGDVKISVCRESIKYFDLNVEDLLPELDEVQLAEAFWKEELAAADHVLTF